MSFTSVTYWMNKLDINAGFGEEIDDGSMIYIG